MAAPRLRLRTFRASDVDDLHEIFSDPETHTIGDGPFLHVDQTRAWVERRAATRSSSGLCWYGLWDRSTGRLIGNCGIFPGRAGTVEPEIGYEIRHDSRRLGFATEAVRVVLAEAARIGVRRVWATVRPANMPSLKVLHRAGMTFDRREDDVQGALLYLSVTLATAQEGTVSADTR